MSFEIPTSLQESTFDFANLAERLASVSSDDDTRATLARLAEMPDAARVGRGLGTLIEDAPEVFHADGCLDTYLTLAAQGPYPQTVLVRTPPDLLEINATRERSFTAAQLKDRLHELLGDTPDQAGLSNGLRRFKRRESLRVFLREVDGITSVRETTAEIADIAEACIESAVRHVARFHQRPDFAEAFCVLGMGKLGARELNFSSDVDLVYVCSDDFSAQGAAAMDAFARDVTAALDRNTAHGYVFRVDLRLRPEGTQGALVQPVSPVAEYYASWGRTWERSALLKARPVAGNLALGEDLLGRLEPFVYRKYLDFRAIDELRAMKESINRHAQLSAIVGEKEEASSDTPDDAPVSPLKSRLKSKIRSFGSSGRPRLRRSRPTNDAPEAEPAPSEVASDTSGVLGWDVKLGIGGIREIEFFVQALQLVHCGTRAGLRVRNTLEALDRLLYGGLINHDDHARLADAYAFFRRVEHRVQMENDRQGHRLPQTRANIAAMAGRMGMEAEVFRDTVIRNRDAVQDMFGRLFAESEQSSEKPTISPAQPDALDTVLGAPVDALESSSVRESLTQLGFARPRQVAGQLTILREKPYGPFSERASLDDQDFAHYLMENAAAAPNADQAFSYLTRFVTQIGDRPGYFEMLRENPHAARLLVHVFGSSHYLAAGLLKEPALFERLLGAGNIAVVRSLRDMRADLSRRLERTDDPAHRLGIIRRFHQEETLRIGLHETGGAASIRVTNEQLSLLAETVIAATTHEVYEPLRTRRRRPGSTLPPLEEIPFGIVAMGKLGGRELGFGSDLDMIFVYENERQWRLEHSFFARLAQRLVRTLSSAGTEGKMYEVDTRLRPSGQQGALVVSLEAFHAYHEDRAELWERQALLRARMILGTEPLHEAFEEARTHHAFDRPLPEHARETIANMTDRIRESMLQYGTLDVKFSPGGLIDLEFFVQYLQLEASQRSNTPGVRSQNTYDALDALIAEPGVAQAHPDLDLRALKKDYERLRTIEARLRMTDHRGQTVIPGDTTEADNLARRLGYQGKEASDSMLAELRQLLARVEEAITR